MHKHIKLLSALFLAIPTISFAANTTNTNFLSSAELNANCLLQGNRIDFGEVSPKNTGHVSVTSYISATCTKQTAYSIVIGSGTSGQILNRKLKAADPSNTDTLTYSIYKNSDFTSLLGDGTNGTSTVDGIGIGSVQAIPLYGYLELNQYIKADYYSDNLTVVINY